jgi:hypothetical protein
MKSARFVAPLLVIAGMTVSLAAPALSRIARKDPSGTKAFVIDGKRFSVTDETNDDLSLIRRELARGGIKVDLPHGGWDDPPPAHPFLRTAFREEGMAPGSGPPLPGGLRREHVLKMETDDGPIDLVFGSLEVTGRSLRNRLRASGWTLHGEGSDEEAIHLATKTRGKETHIVFLEEEGGFLFVRRVEK